MCVPHLQRVLVQTTGSAQKGAQAQQLPVPRVQQVPQQVHTHTQDSQSLHTPMTGNTSVLSLSLLHISVTLSAVFVPASPALLNQQHTVRAPQNTDTLHSHARHA